MKEFSCKIPTERGTMNVRRERIVIKIMFDPALMKTRWLRMRSALRKTSQRTHGTMLSIQTDSPVMYKSYRYVQLCSVIYRLRFRRRSCGRVSYTFQLVCVRQYSVVTAEMTPLGVAVGS